MSISLVVFDLGKVLLDFDYTIPARRIAEFSDAPLGAAGFLAANAPLLVRYESGLINTTQFCDEMRRAIRFTGNAETFSEIFADIFSPIEPMLQLHSALRAQGVRTFIFSNTNDLHISHIRKRYPFFASFDGYILSYEHGAMKPDAKLYEVVERETGCSGGEIIYFDDRAENVAAGTARGWNAILHETPEKSRAALERFGFAIGEV